MKKIFSLLALFSILFLFAVPLAAQVLSRPVIVREGTIDGLEKMLEELTTLYLSGQWKSLQKRTDETIGNVKIIKIESAESIKLDIDKIKNFYFIVFLSREKGEEPRIIRFPWHKPEPDPYASRIPGKKEIYEIVLGAKSDLELKTSYISTELENPLLSQIPKFFNLIEPGIMAAVEKTRKKGLVPVVPAVPNVEIRSITLPYERAKIKVNDVAALSDATLAKAIKTAALKLVDYLEYRNAYASESGKNLAEAICDSIQKAPLPDERKSISEQMRDAVDATYKNHIKKNVPKGGQLKLAMNIEEEFLGMIEKIGAKEVKAEFNYENVPLERVSFGLISTYMIKNSFADERVKVTDAGYYTADPPKNPLTAAIVNFHPLKYDPKSAKMKFAEMFRLFGGFVLTPDYGYCAGAGFSFLRGLSINGGLAILGFHIVNNPQSLVVDGKEIKKSENLERPFKTKWGPVFFLGFGYSFR